MKRAVLSILFLTQNILLIYAGYIYKDRHTIHADAFGAGMLYSINYDYVLETPTLFHPSIGIGFSAFGSKAKHTNHIVLPFRFTVLFGRKNNFVEGGLYLDYIRYPASWHGNYYSTGEAVNMFYFGYRYQNPRIGLYIRPYFTPLHVQFPTSSTAFFNDLPLLYRDVEDSDKKWIVYPGLSIGYTFKQRSLEERAAQKEYRILKRASKKV